MRIKLSIVSNLMFLFYESMACAIYLQEIILFTVISHYLNKSLQKYKINRR